MMSCSKHDSFLLECVECVVLQEKVKKYQKHHHTHTCAKKRKHITIKENEGHGRFDGLKKDMKLANISVCRFKFPKFPLNETKVIRGIDKDASKILLNKGKMI